MLVVVCNYPSHTVLARVMCSYTNYPSHTVLARVMCSYTNYPSHTVLARVMCSYTNYPSHYKDIVFLVSVIACADGGSNILFDMIDQDTGR